MDEKTIERIRKLGLDVSDFVPTQTDTERIKALEIAVLELAEIVGGLLDG